MRSRSPLPLLLVGLLAAHACARSSDAPADIDALRQEVMEIERAFARTMADRDSVAFAAFLADETVFFTGDRPIRGRDAVAAEWAPFFADPVAPFSWDPELVEVLESGTLALTSGPVYDPTGAVVARFNSIWRREASGDWKVVFDRGTPVCPCDAPGQPAPVTNQ